MAKISRTAIADFRLVQSLIPTYSEAISDPPEAIEKGEGNCLALVLAACSMSERHMLISQLYRSLEEPRDIPHFIALNRAGGCAVHMGSPPIHCRAGSINSILLQNSVAEFLDLIEGGRQRWEIGERHRIGSINLGGEDPKDLLRNVNPGTSLPEIRQHLEDAYVKKHEKPGLSTV